MKHLLSILILATILFGLSDIAQARDLVDAAASAQSLFNRIGIAAISIGITLGGILFTLGLAQAGRMVLMSGLIGATAVLGAPALISLLSKIFGFAI